MGLALMGLASWVWALDGWIVLIGVLCAVSCSLLGNFLVLRGIGMLGDAISHAVLPGLALAFIFSGSRSGPIMLLAALLAAIATVVLIEWLRRVSRVDQGASMGVVFTAMFALGIVLIARAADHVDLDPNCVLYGSIELTPIDCWGIGSWLVPKAALTLTLTVLMNLAFVVLFYKELKLTTFDAPFADSLGFSSSAMHYALMILVAITAVASFESVGSVLVVAMLVVPTAAALLVTDRLLGVIVWSGIIAALSAVLGHVSAIGVPALFGLGSTLTAGMMAVSVGGLFVVCSLLGPQRGLLVRRWRQQKFARQVVADDILSYLYRAAERQSSMAAASIPMVTLEEIQLALQLPVSRVRRIAKILCRKKLLETESKGYRLTETGRHRGQQLVRSHRLWELYLVEQAELGVDRIHDKAELWEHVTDQTMRERLHEATSDTRLDPHGSQIPPETR